MPQQLPLIFQGRAEQLITPYQEMLRICVAQAWNAWLGKLENDPAFFFALSPRTRANIVYDHICENIKNEFRGQDGITLTDECRFLVVGIKDEILLRLKRLIGIIRPATSKRINRCYSICSNQSLDCPQKRQN